VADAIDNAHLITLEGCGHAPHLRDPIIINLIIRDFAAAATSGRMWRADELRRLR
jgi:pimeloyl-ACP methyl ester carboxylesterase